MRQFTRIVVLALPLGISGCFSTSSLFSFMGEGGIPVTPANHCPAPSTQETAQQFYDLYLPRKGSGGLPDSTLLTQMRPYLSPALHQALEQARTRQQMQRAAAPDESPELSSGDMFSSQFEGAQQARVIADNKNTATTDHIVLPVDFLNKAEGVANRWEDGVVLVQNQGCWVIDDILYGGNWNATSAGTLKQVLADR